MQLKEEEPAEPCRERTNMAKPMEIPELKSNC